MLDCRLPYSLKKNSWTHFWEKEKVKDKIVGHDLLIYLLCFNLVIDCKIWCPLEVEILRRFIRNLWSCPYVSDIPSSPVYK